MSGTKYNSNTNQKLLFKVESILSQVINIKRVANNTNKYIKSIYNLAKYEFDTIH